MPTRRQIWVIPVAVAALAVVSLYALGDLGLIRLHSGFWLVSALALGPLGIVGVLEVARFLRTEADADGTRRPLQIATVFGVVAFVLWAIVHAVDVGSRELWRAFLVEDLSATLPGGEETVRLLYLGVSSVEASIDVAFDIFYSLSILLFAGLMLRHPGFERFTGGFGIFAASGFLTLNLWNFPVPPGDSGWWDLGPLTAVWWVLVVIQMLGDDPAGPPGGDDTAPRTSAEGADRDMGAP